MGGFERLRAGCAIPAHPLALTAERKLDERRQRALSRYYLDAGAGGLAVGVHTTQFAIRDAGLLRPVLTLAAEEARGRGAALVAGVCGQRAQALAEAELAAHLGYHAALLSLGALRDVPEEALLDHVRAVAGVLPVVGFYLQPAVGGRVLPYSFWRRAVEVENVVAIKIAPFNRYQTIDVLRAVAESGRASEIALYTGNDDNIIADLVTPYCFGGVTLRFAGGLLGQWAVWTKKAVMIHAEARISAEWLILGQQLTDANAALFDAPNGFHGCIAGLHEILRRQGLLAGRWCLDPNEDLSPGQCGEIDRVVRDYPHLTDDGFVRENLDRWLR
ncbi:MAG TPA: dihydrodipicolinate synthase family protein [Solibacterales bacterium]|nr:dihydrodipicolinate synthase family protein [Bryobacterales bacterium]